MSLIIVIQNDQTGDDESANYQYKVLVNEHLIDMGTVIGHRVRNHWTVLVGLLLKQYSKDSMSNELVKQFSELLDELEARSK